MTEKTLRNARYREKQRERGRARITAWVVSEAHAEVLKSINRAMRSLPDRWRHLRRGSTYVVLSREVRMQCSTVPASDDEMLVLYADTSTGHLSVRRAAEFDDGRFAKLENASTAPASTEQQA